MALTTVDNVTTITCDKCGASSIATPDTYNQVFWEEGWALHRGRKYMHLCNKCLSPKARKAMEFVKKKFNL